MKPVIDHEERTRGSNFSDHGFLFFREHPAYPVPFPHEMSLHHHEWHEFIIARSLEPSVRHDLVAEGLLHRFGDWCLISIPACHLHKITVNGLLCQYLIGIDVFEMMHLFSQSPVGHDLKRMVDSWKNQPTIVDLKDSPHFRLIQERINQLLQRYPGNGTLGSLDSLLFLGEWDHILTLISSEKQKQQAPIGFSDSNIILQVVGFLEDHFSRDISVDDCAEHVGISRSSLSHTFKQQCGMSIPQWMARIRLRHAKSLLLDSELDTLTIAMECGFNDNSWFFRQFKDAEGMTPAQWRRLHKKQ